MFSQAYYALEVPQAPPGAPEYLERLLGRLQTALDVDAPREAREALRDTIGFLTRYFGAVLAATSDPQSDTQSVGAVQVEASIHQNLRQVLDRPDPTAVALRSVFFREQLGGQYLPYPHTRLLMRDGWLANGAQTLTMWLTSAIEPDADEDCREEVSSLIPVLSQWLAAASPFFLECRFDYLVKPRHAFHALGLRGLEGGTRIPFSRVELVTRFRDLHTGLPLRTRDMQPEEAEPEPEPEPVVAAAPEKPVPDVCPLAEMVQMMLQSSPPPAPSRPLVLPELPPPPAPQPRAGASLLKLGVPLATLAGLAYLLCSVL